LFCTSISSVVETYLCPFGSCARYSVSQQTDNSVTYQKKTDDFAHVTSAKIDSHVSHLDISKTHVTHNDLDGSTKVSQEMLQDRVHSEILKHEDEYDTLSITSGSSGRVIEAFTMLQATPEAQVSKL
jgi:hypothetical protein